MPRRFRYYFVIGLLVIVAGVATVYFRGAAWHWLANQLVAPPVTTKKGVPTR